MSVKRLPSPAPPPPQPFQPINKAPRLFEPRSQKTHKMLAFSCSTPSSSTVSLGLSLGHGPLTSSAFTFFQMQEFHHQALIYKYMASGLPVPFHLVLPIWKSVASSYAKQNNPSFVECSSGLCFDYRNLMEPEPGRCRRTDGKKWRCSRDVVPDQKYCDRHIHRGRQRSRKPVEGTTTATAITTNVATTTTSVSASVLDETQTIPNTNNGNSDTGNRTESSSCFGFSPVSVLQS